MDGPSWPETAAHTESAAAMPRCTCQPGQVSARLPAVPALSARPATPGPFRPRPVSGSIGTDRSTDRSVRPREAVAAKGVRKDRLVFRVRTVKMLARGAVPGPGRTLCRETRRADRHRAPERPRTGL